MSLWLVLNSQRATNPAMVIVVIMVMMIVGRRRHAAFSVQT